MKKLATTILIIFAIAFAQYVENPHVQDNGGGVKSSASYRSYASIGQAVAGICGTALHINQVGFITAASAYLDVEEKPHTGKMPEKPFVGAPYPNPFNSTCKISIVLPNPAVVKFQVFDLTGKMVYELSEQKSTGHYSLTFDAGGLSSGIYLYNVVIGDELSTNGKLILVK